MADAFISYAREDQDFARTLHAALVDAGHSLWVDWESIHPSSDWFKEIAEGIDQSDAVIFVVSRNSVHSKECRAEVEHARRAEIRIIPVLREQVQPGLIPGGAAAFQWIEFLDDAAFDESVQALRRALETDLDWVKDHTRLRLRALEWDREGRRSGKLLNRAELREAEEWVRSSGEDEDRRPAPLVYDYLAASSRNRRRRQRWFTGAVSVALVIAAGLAVWALLERDTAQEQQRLAFSRELSASSLLNLDDDPELSALLAVEAANTAATVQAEDALRSALANTRARLVLRGHSKDLTEARYSPDGRQIVTASDDTTARLWDAETGRQRAVLRGHRLALGGAEFSPDGSRVLTHAVDYTTRVYETESGRRVAVLRDPNDPRVQTAHFSPDSSRIATSTFTNTTFVWDAAGGEMLQSIPEGRQTSNGFGADDAEFTPDGRVVATAYQGGRIRLWDASTGELVLTRRAPQRVADIQFSPVGNRLLTRSTDGGVMTWSFPEVTPQFVLAADESRSEAVLSREASFSPNGMRIAVADADGAVKVWNEVGQQVATLTGHEGSVNEANFDPSGRYVVTAGDDGAALVWDVDAERVVTRLLGHRSAVTSAEFSPGGDTVLTAGLDGTARVWDSGTVETAPALRPPGGGACEVAAFSPDNKRIAATGCSGSSYIFDVSRKVLRELPDSGDATEAEFSPDGRYVATANFGSNTRVYDVRTGRIVVRGSPAAYSANGSMALLERSEGAQVWDLRKRRQIASLGGRDASFGGAAFSPDGERLYTSGLIDNWIYVWTLPSGKLLERFRAPGLPRPTPYTQGITGANEDIELSRDGSRLLAVHLTGSVRIIDTETGRTTVHLAGSEAPDERMFGGADAIFSPDAESVATKAGWDNVVRIWDANTGRLEMELEDHALGVASAEYDREGRLLATRDFRETVRIWSVTSGDVLLTLRNAQSVDFSPDGRRILISADEARIHDCEVCGDLDELLALAERRVTRGLTQAERERYLHE
jgi:WD40 repeat protein